MNQERKKGIKITTKKQLNVSHYRLCIVRCPERLKLGESYITRVESQFFLQGLKLELTHMVGQKAPSTRMSIK